MRAIILAAGAGRRLAAIRWDHPKCLLPCPSGTLLNNTIQDILVRHLGRDGQVDHTLVEGLGHGKVARLVPQKFPVVRVQVQRDVHDAGADVLRP